MAVAKVCANTFPNTGHAGCSANSPFLDTAGIILTTEDFEFATEAAFATESNWLDGIKAGTVFPIIEGFKVFEDQSTEDQYYEAPNEERSPRRLGKYRFKYSFDAPFEVHKALQGFRNKKARFFEVDTAGNILYATSPDGTKIKGCLVSMVNPERQKRALQDGTPAFTDIIVDLKDAKEWNERGRYVNPIDYWNPQDLKSLAPVELSIVGSPTASEIIVKVAYNAGLNGDGTENLVGISGLLQADLVVSTGSVSGVTDNADGTYTIAGSTFASGTVDLVAPSALTEGLLIKSTGPVSFTI